MKLFVINFMRKNIKFFVSYSHRNKQIADGFIESLLEVMRPSKAYDYQLWMDTGLVVGEEWERQIIEEMNSCDFGLLLVSPSFLGSDFVCEKELPRFTGRDRTPSIPVMLQPIDFKLHDLKGLEELQIFRFTGKRFKEPRAYGECKRGARNDFILALFRDIELKISKVGRS